jgi:hypothetical protein
MRRVSLPFSDRTLSVDGLLLKEAKKFDIDLKVLDFHFWKGVSGLG